jgi:hypothetical protein
MSKQSPIALFAIVRGHSLACPFDLQSLVPVPADVLGLGTDDPAAPAWLWTHRGTAQALRHVTSVSLAFPRTTRPRRRRQRRYAALRFIPPIVITTPLNQPISISTSVASCPWSTNRQLWARAPRGKRSVAIRHDRQWCILPCEDSLLRT